MTDMNQHIQLGFLKHLRDDDDVLKLCRKTVPFTILRSTTERMTCKSIYGYYDRFGKAPKADFEDFFYTEHHWTSDDERELYEKLFGKINSSEASRDYVLARLAEYIERLSYEQTLLKSADYIQKNDVKAIREEFKIALKNTVAFTEVGDDIWDFYPFPEENRLVCPTSIEALDRKIGGYNRKELFLWMGATNRGKSWALVNGALASLKAGKNAVYYTLEMSKESVQHRLLMSMSGLRRSVGDESKRLRVTYFNSNTVDFSDRKSVYTDTKTIEEAKKRYRRYGGSLRVVELKGGHSTVEDIEKHLYTYELRMGQLPDIIFIDYADLLVSYKKFSEDINGIDHVYNCLRGLAVEKNIGIVTASQGNRMALDVKKVDLKHMAKSIGKAMIADAVITLNQEEAEYRENRMRLIVAKMREGKRNYEIEMTQCLSIGAFCLESRIKTDDYLYNHDDEEMDVVSPREREWNACGSSEGKQAEDDVPRSRCTFDENIDVQEEPSPAQLRVREALRKRREESEGMDPRRRFDERRKTHASFDETSKAEEPKINVKKDKADDNSTEKPNPLFNKPAKHSYVAPNIRNNSDGGYSA